MDDGDLGRELSEEVRLFHRGISATNHCDLLITEEETITGSAPRDAAPREALLILKADLLIGRTHRKDDTPCLRNLP